MSGSRTRERHWLRWRASCEAEAKRFESSLREPEAAQRASLARVLGSICRSAFGRAHELPADGGLEAFRERIPIREPGEFGPWTERIRSGEPGVLSREPVEQLVPTSGSTGMRKLVPMTRGSREESGRAVNLWMADVFRRAPAVVAGSAYVATSPALDPGPGDGPVPVGFAPDAAYLDAGGRASFAAITAVDPGLSSLRGEAWRSATREALGQAGDLSFLSLWHPSYLEALASGEELGEWAARWPGLALISSWADGACEAEAERLADQFPAALFQRKGLWLTEGVVTVSYRSACPVALDAGFFEFELEDGRVCLVHELRPGMRARPILTNRSGLCRYRLGDLVEVEGMVASTPSLRWLGRCDLVSDLCGEKISEAQVAALLRELGLERGAVLVPRRGRGQERPSYELRLGEAPGAPEGLAGRIDRALRANPHYAWARDLGQLGPPGWSVVAGESLAASRTLSRDGYHLKGSSLGLAPGGGRL